MQIHIAMYVPGYPNAHRPRGRVLRTVAGALLAAMACLAQGGCVSSSAGEREGDRTLQAPESGNAASGPLASNRYNAEMGETARALINLGGIATRWLTGILSIDEYDPESHKITLHIGSVRAYVGGLGIEVPRLEAKRILGLAGREVMAGVARSDYVLGVYERILGDSQHICLAPAEDLRPLVSLWRRFEEDSLWVADALVMETGVWERFLAGLPTEEGTSITDSVDDLLKEHRDVARDMLSWLVRTRDLRLTPLPQLVMANPGCVPPYTRYSDRRLLTLKVLSLAMRAEFVKLLPDELGDIEIWRRIWVMLKLHESCDRRGVRTGTSGASEGGMLFSTEAVRSRAEL